METWVLERIYLTISKEQQEELINAIEYWIPVAYYNSFHLNVLRFYANCRKDVTVDHIKQRIEELKYS